MVVGRRLTVGSGVDRYREAGNVQEEEEDGTAGGRIVTGLFKDGDTDALSDKSNDITSETEH